MKIQKVFLYVYFASSLLFLGVLIFTFEYYDQELNSPNSIIEVLLIGIAFLICMIFSISLGSIIFLPHNSNASRFIIAVLLSIFTAYVVLGSTVLPAISFW